MVAEESRRLLDVLGDETLRRIATWKMEGHTNEEIAAQLGLRRADGGQQAEVDSHGVGEGA